MTRSLSLAGRTSAHVIDYASRLVLLAIGLLVFSLATTLILQANVGLGAWHAFHYGLTRITPLSYGQASIVVSIAMVLTSWSLKVRLGPATFANAVLVGVFVDLFLAWHIIPSATSPLDGYPMLLAGIGIFGLGTALYIKPRLGAGPRDSFMLAMVQRTGWRVGIVRGVMETIVLFLGYLMGGPIGGGTIIFTLAVGPVVQLWFRVLNVQTAPSNAARPALMARPRIPKV